MASEDGIILLSCLPRAPAAGEATSAVRSALQRVIVRPPPSSMHNAGHVRTSPGTTRAAGARAGTMQHFRALFPSAHSSVVDGKFLRAFTALRARTILAGLTPLPAGGRRGLPTIVAGVAGGRSGLCFLGQRASPAGFSVFSIKREFELESAGDGSVGQSIKIGELMHEHERLGQASACALYDLWGTSNSDVLGGCSRDGAELMGPLAHLATSWDCSSHATRTLGSPPPPACSSLLLVGGQHAPRVATFAIRRSIETLTVAAGPLETWQGAKGLFRCADNETNGEASAEANEQELLRWTKDLEALLSCSENMAEYAMKPQEEPTSSSDAAGSDRADGSEVDDTAIQERKDGGVIGTVNSGAGYEEAEIYRTDSDFSERLWELAARCIDIGSVRSTFSSAFYAVGEGRIFPVVSRDNQTVIGRHIRDGVTMAREARYHDGGSVGVGVPPDEIKSEGWRERGSIMLADDQNLAEAFVELGVYKVTRDLLFWLETHAGVVAADIDRAFPATNHEKPSSDDLGERPASVLGAASTAPCDRRLGRLVTLANTVDLVALAQSYGAPWRQVRALAHAGLAALGRAAGSSGEVTEPSSSPTPVFPIVLPRPIPARARSKLAHPVFWELLLEPTRSERGENATNCQGAEETVSYAMMAASIFQLKGVDEPLVLSGGAAKVAQEALEGCPATLVPEVLSSVAGVDSFAQLKKRQKERREVEAAAQDDAAGVFVCEHRFIPWK